jgi:hypothetical protein
MASPARTPPAGNQSDEALDILRRLEPVLGRMDDRLRKIEIDQAELKGRMTGIEGQLRQIPTLWQLAGLIFAIFGAAFVLIRFASGH